jgi:hypothetical protein
MSYAFLGATEASSVFDSVMAETKAEFPRFKIVPKSSSALMRGLDALVQIVTLGQQDKFLENYTTTLGTTVYVAEAWDKLSDAGKAIVLLHEREHMRQRRDLGGPLYTFLWLIPVLPVGLALGRARLEWGGYKQTLRATAELKGPEAVCDPLFRSKIVQQFTGPSYGWMWPFKSQVEGWFDDELRRMGVSCKLELASVSS